MIPVKDIVYLAAIAVIVAGFFLYRHSLIVDGEQICQTRERAAAEKQAMQDTKIAEDTSNAYLAEISRLRELNNSVVSGGPIRVLCYARKVPAPTSQPGAAHPSESASPGGSVPEVSAGTGTGIELAGSLQRFALAADLESARHRACLNELKEP